MIDIIPLAADTPLSEAPLAFLDLETTGLELSEGHRVAEIGLLRARAGHEEGRLASLVAPGRPIDPEAALVTGLSDAQLAAAPPFAALADELLALASGAVLVAHNLPFDRAFLNAELARLGRAPLAGPMLDTLALARRLLPRRRSYSLSALSADLGLARPTHRAIDDVISLRGLFAHLAGLMAELGVASVGDALRLERGLPPGAPEPVAPAPIDTAIAESRRLLIVYSSRSTPEPTTRIIRPLQLSIEGGGALFLRAFCELRQDFRSFALRKIERAELVEGDGPA